MSDVDGNHSRIKPPQRFNPAVLDGRWQQLSTQPFAFKILISGQTEVLAWPAMIYRRALFVAVADSSDGEVAGCCWVLANKEAGSNKDRVVSDHQRLHRSIYSMPHPKRKGAGGHDKVLHRLHNCYTDFVYITYAYICI